MSGFWSLRAAAHLTALFGASSLHPTRGLDHTGRAELGSFPGIDEGMPFLRDNAKSIYSARLSTLTRSGHLTA
jgi:hypothetical protein